MSDETALQNAIIGLLWNACADDESCDGDCEADGDAPFAVCSAMRALRWGSHFTAVRFEQCVADFEAKR